MTSINYQPLLNSSTNLKILLQNQNADGTISSLFSGSEPEDVLAAKAIFNQQPGSDGEVTSITGTANQITASASTGAITLSVPSDFRTSSLKSPAATPLTLGTTDSGAAITVLSASNNVGIGTTTPVQKLDVAGVTGGPSASGTSADGALRLLDGSYNMVLDMGVDHAVSTWIQSRDKTNYVTNYNLALQPNGGNVGIGTTTPTNGQLEIGGNSDAASGPNRPRLALTNTAGTAVTWSIQPWSMSGDANLSIYRSGSTGNILLAPTGGNVGIGTTAPRSKLEASADAETYLSVARTTASSDGLVIGGITAFTGTADAWKTARIKFVERSGASIPITDIVFETQPVDDTGTLVEKMRIKSGGDVTIASSTAGSAGAGALVVTGGLATGAASYFGGAVTVSTGSNATPLNLTCSNAAGTTFGLANTGGAGTHYFGGYNAIIGGGNATDLLINSAGQTIIRAGSTNVATFSTTGAATFAGNVAVSAALGYATGIHSGATTDSSQQLILSSSGAYSNAYVSKDGTTLGIGFSSSNGSFVEDNALSIVAATKAATFAGAVTAMIAGTRTTINDDSVATFTPLVISGSTRGFFVILNNDYSESIIGAYFSSGAGYYLYTIVKSANVTTTNTTTMTGTTGTDGKMNIGFNNGIIYIENRLGGTGNFLYLPFGGAN
jgi:hypothetical protein